MTISPRKKKRGGMHSRAFRLIPFHLIHIAQGLFATGTVITNEFDAASVRPVEVAFSL
jgi:hypothetical protein